MESLPKLEEYPFIESLYVPPQSSTKVENVDDDQERELVLFVLFFSTPFIHKCVKPSVDDVISVVIQCKTSIGGCH